ncbi:SulP family inorganic anion transporter [Flavobacterium arcticum]|uniref:SulP family inorganic anion transporter n=1 Tax=Flavobacterium arcticum TaxID=1784713 RepID=A0A345HEP1_9FLAO|nr:SulP family inorganic anion transporter [Flavobacterium arcticum]AXG75051.1 SulP family inorganic anion transporter [Flavobacterium arcticum]KAF2511166.1 SulP family inorganic anion transporter [Flavobacterium arcticum]
MTKKMNLFANLKADFPSGLVVFLVALPLCLGIALASGAPPLSGILSGIIGGIVIGSLSNSNISVSGPAAGLIAIVLTAISTLGSFEAFLLTVSLAGLMQLALGFLKAGSISNYFPSNVIEGMLAGIGVIIIINQIEHALGYDIVGYSGSESLFRLDGGNPFSDIPQIISRFEGGAVIITLVSIFILVLWERIPALKKLKMLPGALVAVIVGILINEFFIYTGSSFALGSSHLVKLPIPESFEDFKNVIVTPDFSAITNVEVWVTAATIMVVASIETLLCIEASDRMDVHKRYTDTNRELKAQGIGNAISGLIGGLPITSVVVRSSANASAGAKTKMSAIIHGVLLLLCVLAIPTLLNKIPFATLAAVLIVIGYKLARPVKLKHFWSKGIYQFIPFIATLLAVVLTDLLKGVALGMIISFIFILRGNLKRAYNFRKKEYNEGDIIHIDLAQEVSFLNKASIKATLNDIPENSKVIIDASETVYIAYDVLDLIEEFATVKAIEENIDVTLIGFKTAYQLQNAENNNVFVTHNDDNVNDRKEKQDIY